MGRIYALATRVGIQYRLLAFYGTIFKPEKELPHFYHEAKLKEKLSLFELALLMEDIELIELGHSIYPLPLKTSSEAAHEPMVKQLYRFYGQFLDNIQRDLSGVIPSFIPNASVCVLGKVRDLIK